MYSKGKKMYWGMMLIAAKAITAEGESHTWEEAICLLLGRPFSLTSQVSSGLVRKTKRPLIYRP